MSDAKKVIETALGLTDPLDHLSPRAQKIAQQKVLTTLTDKELAARHKLTTRAYNIIIRDANFQAYLKQLQHSTGNEEFVNQMRRQEEYLRDKIFQEVASRFETPDIERDLGPNATVEEKETYMKRFAHFANFESMMRVFDASDKRAKLNVGVATEISAAGNSQLVDEVRERYEKHVVERRVYAEKRALAAQGITVEMQEDGTFAQVETPQAQLIDEPACTTTETVTLEEYSITRRSK